jgi:citrate synthase
MTEALKTGPGLRNVVAGESSISSIDGEKGLLAYRGIDIHALARHSNFEEVVYLLHRGALPRKGELEAFRGELVLARAIPPQLLEILRILPRATHPMTSLRTAVSALGGLEPGDESPAGRKRAALHLTSQTGTLVAAIERVRNGRAPLEPRQDLSHAANFLYMLQGTAPSPSAERAMDLALVLHADHEFNASTFAARVAASTLANMHGAITAALATLQGPLHGGANEAVMNALETIGSPGGVEAYVRDALARKQKLMGFGHAVYKTEDPRATHLRETSRLLGDEKGEPRWYDISAALERTVKAQKGLNANVDFYSASVYRALGIPTDLFTPVFAVSRIAGWTAHVLEQVENNRLIRPECEYTGPRDVPYVPMERR